MGSRALSPRTGGSRWLRRSIGQAVLAVVGASLLIWLVVPLTPGDPAAFILRARNANYQPSARQLEAERAKLGLDDNIVTQYRRWVAGALHGDLGESYRTGRPVADHIGDRLPNTLRLAATAIALAVPIAIGLALLSVAFANRLVDHLVRVGCALVASVPAFVLALVASDLFAVRLGWVDAITDGSWGDALLPAACLALPLATWWAQLLRVHMLEAVGRDYDLVAAARGSGPIRTLVVHTLPNGLLPFLSMLGLGMAFLFAGTAVVEVVFNWPGLGTLLLRAVGDRDLAVIQGVALLSTVVFVTVSLLMDTLSRIIDTRLRDQTL